MKKREKNISAQNQQGGEIMLDKLALTIAIIGGLNWGSIGIFQFDIVAWIFGGQSAIVSRIIYILVGLAAVWCISLLFHEHDHPVRRDEIYNNDYSSDYQSGLHTQ